MAAAALTPRVRMMAICDRVRESKYEAGVFHLKGVRQGMTADVFPFVPARLRLFFVLSSPRSGTYPCYVRVVNDRTDRTVFYTHIDPRPTFGVDGGLFIGRVPIRCRFPEEGQYTVQVWFFQERGSDVLKGEMPNGVRHEYRSQPIHEYFPRLIDVWQVRRRNESKRGQREDCHRAARHEGGRLSGQDAT